MPETQEHYAEVWKSLDPCAEVICERTIDEALKRVRMLRGSNVKVHALVIGSLHLVSGALHLLESPSKE